MNQLGVSKDKFLFPNESLHDLNSSIQTVTVAKNIKVLSVGDNHNYLLDYDNNLFFWGVQTKDLDKNEKDLSDGIPKLTKIFPNNKLIKNIYSKGHQTIFLLENGEAFVCSSPLNIINPFKEKTQILALSCSYHFVIFLSRKGMLYSYGTNNSEGELGHGDRIPKTEPTLIKSLAKEIIVSVECGQKHVITKTNNNKIFTWGWGKMGQLGLGYLKSEFSPVMLDLTNYSYHGSVTQIQAGFTSSLILFENRRIFWWGSNGTINKQKIPIEMALSEKVVFFY